MSRRITALRASIGGGIAALAVTAVIVATSASTTSASYQDTASVPAQVTFGTVDISVAGEVNFAELEPSTAESDHVQTQQVTLTNSGTVDGDVTVGTPFTVSDFTVPASAQGVNLNQVKVRVPGYLNTWTPLGSMPQTVAVGKLGVAGSATASKVVKFEVKIDSAGNAADNKFMGVKAKGSFTATLTSD